MKFLRIALVGLTLSLISGCFTEEREMVAFSKLKNGMSETELKSLLGNPDKIENTADFVVWNYAAGMVFFRDGKVYSWTEAPPHP